MIDVAVIPEPGASAFLSVKREISIAAWSATARLPPLPKRKTCLAFLKYFSNSVHSLEFTTSLNF